MDARGHTDCILAPLDSNVRRRKDSFRTLDIVVWSSKHLPRVCNLTSEVICAHANATVMKSSTRKYCVVVICEVFWSSRKQMSGHPMRLVKCLIWNCLIQSTQYEVIYGLNIFSNRTRAISYIMHFYGSALQNNWCYIQQYLYVYAFVDSVALTPRKVKLEVCKLLVIMCPWDDLLHYIPHWSHTFELSHAKEAEKIACILRCQFFIWQR